MKAILGLKKGMTRVFINDKAVAVTVVDVSDCVVAKTFEKGVELGLGKVKSGKSLTNKYKEVGFVPQYRKYVTTEVVDKKAGEVINAAVFAENDIVTVCGTSKGKGFAGVVKRHHFHGGPKTHGQSDKWRSPGAIGAGTDPGRVWKNTRMAGKMGHENVTQNGRVIVKILSEDNLLLLSGPVPGNRGDLVLIYTK